MKLELDNASRTRYYVIKRYIVDGNVHRGSLLLEQSLLSLTEATFYILLSLSAGRKHGYAILKDVSTLSDATLELSTSTLYGALGQNGIRYVLENHSPSVVYAQLANALSF